MSPVAFWIGPLPIRWYALSFLATFLLGRWYLLRLLRRDHPPMREAAVDDLLAYVVLGVIAGGRLGYAAFYAPDLLAHPLALIQLWHGGMSFHGGLLGLVAALVLFARRRGIAVLRLLDYVGCAAPFGLVLVRLANFANGELWGRPTGGPWGVVFPGAGDGLPRHPSQLYEAVLEGAVIMALLGWLFWRTDARRYPGRIAGAGLVWYAVARFCIEAVRQPDRGLDHLSWGLTMGQTLSVPVMIGGLALLFRSFAVPPSGSPATR